MVSKNGLYKHRILPGHMGGTYAPENVVLLTIEEHAEAHRKLYIEHGNYKDWLAWKTLSGQISKKELSRELELLRRRHISESSLGRVVSQETREKISKAHTGRRLTKQHRESLSRARMGKVPWNKGKTFTAETKQKMSKAKQGKPWSAVRRLAFEKAKIQKNSYE